MPVAGLRNRFPFFQSLQTDEVEQFLSYCRRLRAEAGTNLWQEGDADNFAAFILDGKLGIALLRHIFLTTARRLTKSYERIASVF